MKFRIPRTIPDIDEFIDTRLFAFPYIDDVKNILEDGELDDINEYARQLKTQLKDINRNITKEEREAYNFYPRHIKEMFDAIMFIYYEKPFFKGLEKLLCKYSGYAYELIEDFYFKKQYDTGIMFSKARFAFEDLMQLDRLVEIRKIVKNKTR